MHEGKDREEMMLQHLPHPVRWAALLAAVAIPFLTSGCQRIGAQPKEPEGPVTTITDVHIASTPLRTGVKRFGINLAGQNFYDSGQMMRNLVYNNPGFEGETWQAIIRCATVSDLRCTEANQWNQWPADFLAGAQFEFISGSALGTTGTIESNSAANPQNKDDGISLHFARIGTTPAQGDFMLVRKTIPGNAEVGWWPGHSPGATITTETRDLAPNTPGKQALHLTALLPMQNAAVVSYFDSFAGRSFVQMKGPYRIAFRAKALGGNDQIQVALRRDVGGHSEVLFNRPVPLTRQWHDYSFDFVADENGNAIGTAALSFAAVGAELLLDDVSLTQRPTAANPTAFRDEVVETLRQLHPGVLRYMDGEHLGSSIDNLIAPAHARMRAGWSEHGVDMRSIPMGLPEFLQLAHLLGAEPWFTMPSGITPQEAKNLIEYLAGPADSPYGAKRAAFGQTAPWTDLFPMIHLELGNEMWNGPTFAGAAMPDPIAYGERARQVFLSARSHPAYRVDKFDLVIGSFSVLPEWTKKELAHSGGYDTAAIAPYVFTHFEDDSSDEAIFGPMFAQPERFDSYATGPVAQQASVSASAAHPAKLAVYEVNTGVDNGTVPQTSFDRVVPSLGTGLTVVDHMLLMLRDQGVMTQSIWALPGYQNGLQNTLTHKDQTTPLYGVVVDMGGSTNLRRPSYLAEKLVNEAILPTMLGTSLTGANPSWHQELSRNDQIKLEKAHILQTFAFADGARRTLIVINLDRTQPQPVTFSGEAPIGPVKVSLLNAEHLDDTNEVTAKVAVKSTSLAAFDPHTPYQVPAHSMTVFSWTAGR